MSDAWQDRSGARSFGMPALTPVVKALLIANVALFVLQWVVFSGWMQPAFDLLQHTLALEPRIWKEHFPLVPLWQLVTYGFLHGGPGHLLSNLLFLYFFGTLLEGELGSRRFLIFYLVAVALAGACQMGIGLALGHAVSVVGASGGVLAVACALATLHPTMRLIFIVVPVTLRTLALVYVALELIGAIQELKGQASNVASFAHLSGAMFGHLAVRARLIWFDPLAEVESWRERRGEAREASDQERLDALLAKISREGIHALSPGERAFLKRVSQRK